MLLPSYFGYRLLRLYDCAGKCLAITLELSENKWRPEADLAALWTENKDALVELPLVAALGGERRCQSALLVLLLLLLLQLLIAGCRCSSHSYSTDVPAAAKPFSPDGGCG